jgi:hypothetical protein
VDPTFDRALAKDPERRPGSAAEIVDAVREALGPELVDRLGPPSLGARAARVPATTELRSKPGGPGPRAAQDASPRRGRPALLAAAVVGAAVVGAAVAALVLDDDASGGSGVQVPSVFASAQPLGSALPEPDRSVGCSGEAPAPGSEACSILQTELPDAEIVVPADGKVVGWAVRGASGEIALDVIRPRGADTVRVARSEFESAGNTAPHHFRTALPVERGDVLALELGTGAAIGVRETEGAATQRWLAPEGGAYGLPDEGEGTGFDHEVMLRADFVAGGTVEQPERLLGAAAAAAPPGTVRERIPVEISEPPTRVEIAVVEVGGRVALDLFDEGSRRVRMFLPGLVPGGKPVELEAVTYEGEGSAEADLWWVNPNSGRLTFHLFAVYPRELEFLG